MRKFLRRFFCALLSLVLVAAVSTAIAVPAVIRSRGDLSDYMVSEEFQESIGKANAKRAKDTSARIMSANLLVHYESWGGTDAHKRAKMFLQVLDTYRPDVVAVQEMSIRDRDERPVVLLFDAKPGQLQAAVPGAYRCAGTHDRSAV